MMRVSAHDGTGAKTLLDQGSNDARVTVAEVVAGSGFPITSGTFVASVENVATQPIPFNASFAVMKARLEAVKKAVRFSALYEAIGPKVKIVWSMLQMLSLLGICFGVQWPKAYEQVVREVRETINLNFVNLVTVSCYMQWNYFHSLLLRTLFPAFIILVLILTVKIRRRVVGREERSREAPKSMPSSSSSSSFSVSE